MTQKNLLILIIINLLFQVNNYLYSQDEITKRCNTTEYLQKQKALNPELSTDIKKAEDKIQAWIKNNKFNKADQKIFVIPVIFHILYNNDDQNLSDAQVYSQLDVLNEDYRRYNNDAINTPNVFQPVAADCQIEFCLAQRTPDGKPTNGIIRKQTSVVEFSTDNNMKHSISGGDDIWDRDKYLNIWVCNITSGFAGFSTKPGSDAPNDGVVLSYMVFGRTNNTSKQYNIGRSATHEIGHWLDLDHVWGDGESCPRCNCTDRCEDTPWQSAPNYKCPEYPHPSCYATSDIFMDYMDYTDDECMNVFTKDQSLIMLATLATHRSSLEKSDGCVPVTQPVSLDFKADQVKIAATRSINFTSTTDGKFKKWLWLFDGGKPASSTLKNPQDVYYNKTGLYTVTLIASNDSQTVRVAKYKYIEVSKAGKNDEVRIIFDPYINESLAIDFGDNMFFKVQIRVFNLLGQMVFSYLLDNKTNINNKQIYQLPFSLNNEIYIVQLQTQNGFIYKKIMMQH